MAKQVDASDFFKLSKTLNYLDYEQKKMDRLVVYISS